MKVTNAELMQAKPALASLMELKLPVKVAWGLAQIIETLEPHMTAVEKVHQKILTEYGEPDPSNMRRLQCLALIPEKDDEGNVKKDDKGNVILVVNPKHAPCMEAVGELMTQELAVNIQPIVLPENVEVETSVLLKLQKFVKVP